MLILGKQKRLITRRITGLDMVGASIGTYLLFWGIVGEGTSFGRFATAILGSIIVVAVVQQISERFVFSSLRSTEQ